MEQMQKTYYFNKQIFIKKTKGSISDNYTKLANLGTGGYGNVYSVKDKTTGIIYACKEITKSRIKDKQKIKNEVEILMKTDHPNIVRLYEVYEDELSVYLIIEQCKGGELLKRISQKKIFTEIEACIIFKQIMTALNYCHNLNICHRDLKPENILLTSQDPDNFNIKIADFGLSVIYTNKNKYFTQTVGSSYYISPEVINGNYNNKCDLWSAGVILYFLLSGILPFNAPSVGELYKIIINKQYTFNYPQWINISQDAKDLIKHLLCNEKERYSANDVLNCKWIKNTLSVQNLKVSKKFNLINNYLVSNEEFNKNVTMKNNNLFSNYINLHKFKKLILTLIAIKLNDEEIENLKKMFNLYDLNMDGTITYKEFIYVISKYIPITSQNMKDALNIFKSIDTDISGRIDFTEFLAWTMGKKIYLDEQKLKNAFEEIDVNKTGKLSKSEFKKVLKIKGNFYDKKIEDLIKKYDLNHDGCIDYKEYLYMMNTED